jgi:hypothetical protein
VAADQEGAHIAFERSGGFAGITVRAEVDTADLPEDEAAEYRALLERLDLSGLARPAAPRAGQPDRYQYDIRVHQGGRTYELSYGEAELPEELRPLVHRLGKRATRRG